MAIDATHRPTACPSCGATVRTDVSWCGLCYASLTPEPEPEPEPEPTPQPRRGRHARVEPDPTEPDPVEPVADAVPGVPASDVDAIADRLLAELAASRDPQPSWVGRLPQSSGGKAGLIIGGVVVGTLVLIAAMGLLGLFL